LYVGDLAVANPHQIHAADVTLLAVLIGPALHPGKEGPLTQRDYLFCFKGRSQ
jgi:hypothetical protein